MDTLNKYKRLPESGLNYVESLYKNNTPRVLHTYRAFNLFIIAVSAGLFEWKSALDSKQYGQWIEAHKPLKSYLQLAEIPHRLLLCESGPIKTQQHLAYWCICASTYLGLDRGPKETTYWEPFEDLFQLPRRTMSRATAPLDLDRDSEGRPLRDSKGWPIAREEYTKEITAFFNDLETALNPEQQ